MAGNNKRKKKSYFRWIVIAGAMLGLLILILENSFKLYLPNTIKNLIFSIFLIGFGTFILFYSFKDEYTKGYTIVHWYGKGRIYKNKNPVQFYVLSFSGFIIAAILIILGFSVLIKTLI